MIFQLLRGELDFASALTMILAALVIIFLILPFHEWAHAFAAKCLGDTSIKYRGRLTLNPLNHIDPIGALCIILIGFGWAKPVEIDARNFKNPKVGMGLSALAGPVANIVAAMFGGLVLNGLFTFCPDFLGQGIGWYVYLFLWYYTVINVSLAVFNLVPIPPLDGSKILFMFLPDKWVYTIYRYENYFFPILLVLVWFDILPIDSISNFVTRFIFDITAIPFGLF